MKTFEQQLKELINYNSKENESNTPDFILAQYMNECLAAFTNATKLREKYYGREDIESRIKDSSIQEIN